MNDEHDKSAAAGATGFTPHRISELPLSGHLVFLFCLLLNIFAGFHFYSPLLDNGWAGFDDQTWRRDAAQRDRAATIFDPLLRTGHEAMDTSYVPVQSVIYHLSINTFDQGPWLVRVVGLWAHVINSLLILLLVFRFTGSLPAAHITSLLFLLYPHNATTTAWLCASLAHGLVLTLYLWSFLLAQGYLHRFGSRRWGWWRLALSVLVFVTAVLTKELSSTLAGAVLLYDALVVRGPGQLWPVRWRTYLGLLARSSPYILVVTAAVVIQSMKYDTGFVATKFGGMEFGARNPLRALELATVLFHFGGSWSDEHVLWAMGALWALLAAGIWLTRRRPVLLFLVLWAPMVLAPFTISNFRDVHTLSRYLYEETAVLAVLLAVLGCALVRRYPALRWPAVCLSFFALSASAARVVHVIN